MNTNQTAIMEQIRRIAPSVFATKAWEGVSDKYTFIPTFKILESLMENGWEVTRVQQQRTKIEGKKEFAKHIVRLTNGAVIDGVKKKFTRYHTRFRRSTSDAVIDSVLPEIVLVNSHNRESAYQLHAGFFRVICANGLTVGDTTFEKISIRHSGKILDDVLCGAERIAEEMPRITNCIKQMQKTILTSTEKGAFAAAALQLKYEPEEIEKNALQASSFLYPKRRFDHKPDLWTTFNVVQENLMKGGLRYEKPEYTDDKGQRHPSQRRFTRAVKSIEGTKLNKALWTLAISR
jgi:hypothetical protein